MDNEQIILVNEKDEVIGQAEKLAAHQQALLHRAFSVMLYRQTPAGLEFLLQKRADNKYHCGGLWTNTCCSHPRPGEDTKVAAERRLFEELGIHAALIEIGHFTYIAHFQNGLTEHEYDHVFIAPFSSTPSDINPQEISVIKWCTLTNLTKDLQESPETFTPWLPQVISLVTRHLF